MDFRVGDTVVASAALFAWRHDDRVIIVDIDGTITKAPPPDPVVPRPSAARSQRRRPETRLGRGARARAI